MAHALFVLHKVIRHLGTLTALVGDFVRSKIWPEHCTFRKAEDFREDDTRFFPEKRTIHNILQEASAVTRLDVKDQRSTVLTLAKYSGDQHNAATFVMRPAQAGALTYTCSPKDGLRVQVLSASGAFAQTPPLCSASSESLGKHLSALMDMTTNATSSHDSSSDLKKSKKGQHHSKHAVCCIGIVK
jgi:hypothetical protein